MTRGEREREREGEKKRGGNRESEKNICTYIYIHNLCVYIFSNYTYV